MLPVHNAVNHKNMTSYCE